MTKQFILPLIAVSALGLAACTKHSETENVTINETSVNSSDANLEAIPDANLTDNGADAALDNSANATENLSNG